MGIFAGQLLSSVNFPLAQKWGLQENPKYTDKLVQRAERYVAYWDLVTLVWMPLTGVLMLMDSGWWPLVGLIASAIYFDTSGREAAKNLGFQHEGIQLGQKRQRRFFFATYIIMALLALIVGTFSVHRLLEQLS